VRQGTQWTGGLKTLRGRELCQDSSEDWDTLKGRPLRPRRSRRGSEIDHAVAPVDFARNQSGFGPSQVDRTDGRRRRAVELLRSSTRPLSLRTSGACLAGGGRPQTAIGGRARCSPAREMKLVPARRRDDVPIRAQSVFAICCAAASQSC
jgi:hypothetical protein